MTVAKRSGAEEHNADGIRPAGPAQHWVHERPGRRRNPNGDLDADDSRTLVDLRPAATETLEASPATADE